MGRKDDSTTKKISRAKPRTVTTFTPMECFLANMSALLNELNHCRRMNRMAPRAPDWSSLYFEWIELKQIVGLKIPDEESELGIMNGSDVYENLDMVWTLKYHPVALRQIREMSDEAKLALFERLLMLSSGTMELGTNCNGVCNEPIALKSQIPGHTLTILLETISDQYEASGNIYLLDIEAADSRAVVAKYLRTQGNSAVNFGFFDLIPFFTSVKVLSDSRIAPKSLENLHPALSSLETKSELLSKINEATLSSLTDSESCQGFVRLLQQMSTFKLRLTDEQVDLIGTPGNLFAIGRSGTGKTTCALLRLFTTEVLFKYRANKEAVQLVNAKRFDTHDIDSPCGLHHIFTTVSPYLIDYVKKTYLSLKEKIKEEMSIRKRRRAERAGVPFEDSESRAVAAASECPSNMQLWKDSDFPVFIDFKKLQQAIDATLKYPFFARDSKSELITVGSQAAYHKNEEGAFMIQKVGLKYPVPSFEVTFDYFAFNFWPLVHSREVSFDASQLWFEISAIIKGSANSYKFSDGCLPKDLYLIQNNKSTLLSRAEKEMIWGMFTAYRNWKESLGAYDAQDVVNYALASIAQFGYLGVPVHYLMIDEVQDLTPAMLFLLWKLTEHQLFLSGDTAQTIAKGAGFRFKDFSHICQQEQLREHSPTMKYLTINFRSHQEILKLANLIVDTLEMAFPKLIDKLQRETSPSTGPKPIVVIDSRPEYRLPSLFSSHRDLSADLLIGSDQVIIVRDKEGKKRIPASLEKVICLTVYESKGLEFNDVVLFDFFSTSRIEETDWRTISNIYIDQLSEKPLLEINKKGIKARLEKMGLAKHASLCQDLKMLYVAITRTRVRLVIYESDSEKGAFMLTCLRKLDLIANNRDERQPFLSISIPTDPHRYISSWRSQGDNLMRNNLYREAAKCYANIGDTELESKALAFALSHEGSSELNYCLAKLSRADLSQCDRDQFLSEKQQAFGKLREASRRFMEVNLRYESARCDFSCADYTKAVQKFTELRAWKEGAESYIQLDQYHNAAECYEQLDAYQCVIACYARAGQFENAILKIAKYQNYMISTEYEQYAYHYVNEFCAAFQASPEIEASQYEELKTNTDSETALKLIWAIGLLKSPLRRLMEGCKSDSIMEAVYNTDSSQSNLKDLKFAFEFIEYIGFPKLNLRMAIDFKFPNVFRHCQINLAHYLTVPRRTNLKQIYSKKYTNERKLIGKRATKELSASLSSGLRTEIGSMDKLRDALILFGYTEVLITSLPQSTTASLRWALGAYEQSKPKQESPVQMKIQYLYYCIMQYAEQRTECSCQCFQPPADLAYLPEIFTCNRQYRDYIYSKHDESSALQLIECFSSSLSMLAGLLQLDSDESILQVADAFTATTMFVFGNNTSASILKYFNFDSFGFLLKWGKISLEILTGERCFPRLISIILDSMLVSLNVHRILDSALVACLPNWLYYVIHRSSYLFPAAAKLGNLVPLDLETENYLISRDEACNLLIQHLVESLTSMTIWRHASFRSLQSKDVKYLNNLNIPKEKHVKLRYQELLTASYANMYGEIHFLLSIRKFMDLIAQKGKKLIQKSNKLKNKIKQRRKRNEKKTTKPQRQRK